MTLNLENMTMLDKVKATLRVALDATEEAHSFAIQVKIPKGVVDLVTEEMTTIRSLIKLMDDYVFVHKSHIETEQQYDMAKYGFLTRAMVQVYAVDVTPEIEILYSELSQDDLLAQHRDYCVGKLATYLEAPKPERTQPDPS